MKVTTEELEQCEVLATIEVDPEETQELLKKAARRIAREVKIPGFRPGKAPFNTVVRRFGIEAIQQEALEQSVEKLIKEALDEVELKPYAQIGLDDVSWDPLVIKVKVPLPPKLELGNYRDVQLEVEPVEVTDEDVQETLEIFQEQNATWTPVERPSQIGDLISMTVTTQAGEEILDENDSVEYELRELEETEENQPDLTTHLLGLSAGDRKTFIVTYPEEFRNQKYAGKEVAFNVEVSGVKEKEIDSLDDDFVQQVSDFETLAELKEDIRKNIKQQRERVRDFELGYKALEKIIEEAEKIEWPPILEEEELEEELDRYEQQLKEMGVTLDAYLQMQSKTREEFKEEIRPKVITRMQRGLVMGKVAALENLEVSHSEILEKAKAFADQAGGGEQIWRSILTSDTQQNIIATDVLTDKVIHLLAAIAKGEAPEPKSESEEDAVEGEAMEDETESAISGSAETGPEAGQSVISGEESETESDEVKSEPVGQTASITEEEVEKEPVEESAQDGSEETVTTKA